MSFYRTILTAVAALGLAAPAFAAETSHMNAAPSNVPATQMTAPAAQQPAMVNLNSATAKELMKVKGINASRARAIVAYRKKHGNFKSVDELSSVKGFKKMKADKMHAIASHLSVE